MKRRHAILLLGGASSGAMSVGTGAFSSVEADRGVEVNIVDDDEAYLSLDEEAGDGFVQIRNQFAGDLDLTVTASLASGSGTVEVEKDDGDVEVEIESDDGTDGGGSAPDNSVDLTIPLGNPADVIAECDGGESLDLDLTFSGEVSDTGTTVEKTQTFTVECDEGDYGDTTDEDVTSEVTKVKFTGNGKKFRVLTSEEGVGNGDAGVVNVKLYCGEDGEIPSEGFKWVRVNTKLEIDDFDDDDLEAPIAGVKIEGIGVFENPGPGNGNTVDREDIKEDPF